MWMTVEEQSEGFALKKKTLFTCCGEVVKQTQPQEQGCGFNISATKNPGTLREEGSSVEGLHVVKE